MSEFEYSVLDVRADTASALQQVLDSHAAKGWRLHTLAINPAETFTGFQKHRVVFERAKNVSQ